MEKFIMTFIGIFLSLNTNAEVVFVDGIYYDLNNEAKTAVVSNKPGYQNCYSGNVYVPETVLYEDIHYDVIGIGRGAFIRCINLNFVQLPSSIREIGNSSFYGCENLQEITIPYGVEIIGGSAFEGCNSLTSIEIPYSVKTIQDRAFLGCSNLTTIVIPENIYDIGGGAFHHTIWYDRKYNESPEDVIYVGKVAYDFKGEAPPIVSLNDGTLGISANAFGGETNLYSISIPNSVRLIGHDAFLNCTSLYSITIPGSVDSVAYSAFQGCTKLTTATLSDGVKALGQHVFYGCSQLEDVTIPASLERIWPNAFEKCNRIRHVHISDLAAWLNIAFYDEYSNPLYYGHHLYLNGEEIEDLVLPNDVTSIKNYVFVRNLGLKSVTFHNEVLSIGISSFEGCENLEVVPINSGCIEIGDNAFYRCLRLNAIEIPNTVQNIGENAFRNCRDALSISLPDDIKKINKGTFYGCLCIKKVRIPSSVEIIYQEAFGNCSSLDYIEAEPIVPPFFYDDSFSNYDALVKVPKGMVDDYKSAIGWKNFSNIAESFLYKLTYFVDDELYKTYDIDYLSLISPEPAPNREGHSFSGWSEIPETMPAHDVIVNGYFTVNKYKLTYLLDNQVYKMLDVEYGASIMAEPAPSKEGYTFSGWSEIPETMPAHDVTVTGSFVVNQYLLTYMVDGAVYKSLSLDYGTKVDQEPSPTKEGYTFSGWSEIPETMPAHDVVVNGSFIINKYKLTYLVDGMEYKSYEIEYDAAINHEPAPVKEGYTFSGWSGVPERMPAHDVTVTGTFAVNQYLLLYILDGKEYKTLEVDYGAMITPEPNPEQEGYTFSGWSDIPPTMPAHTVIITGTFTINSYKLTYILNDEIYKQQAVVYGSAISPEPTIEREGHTFSGWSDIPVTMPAHDVTVTGTLTVNRYILTYILDGREYKTLELDYGTTIIPEPNPEKEGYTFSGWAGLPETMPARFVIVTGTFSINSYTLTYMIDDEVYKQVKYEYGAIITPEPKPEGDYKSFEWVGIPATMPSHDVTVNAVYETGITKILLMVKQGQARVYSPNGKLLNRPQKGLNIIVQADGKVRKVVVK